MSGGRQPGLFPDLPPDSGSSAMNSFPAHPREDEEFSRLVFTDISLANHEFARCRFIECSFVDADLSGAQFDSCAFSACNLSNPRIDKARFIDIDFSLCKLAGLAFYRCSQGVFDLRFSGCHITSCNFSDVRMKGCGFKGCEIKECWFQDSFLVEADFSGSTFLDTLFHGCDLQKASFLGSHGYSIDPRNNKVRKARFSLPEVLSLLEGFEIVIAEG